MSKRLLLITYSFSPLAAPEAILTSKLVELIPDHLIDVLTIDHEKLGLSLDRSPEKKVSKEFGNIYRVAPPSWCGRSIFKLLRYLVWFPDKFVVFNRRLLKKAKTLVENDYDVILTWSQWHSVHLIGAALKKNNPKMFWIAHLSDPWSCNPYLPQNYFFILIQRFFENDVFLKADQLHFTSKETKEVSVKNYRKNIVAKSYVVHHSFSESDVIQDEIIKKDKFIRIRYIGNFYGDRNPVKLLESLEMLIKKNSVLFENVQFEVFGLWLDVRNPSKYVSQVCKKHFKFFEPVTYEESLKLMRSANILLVLDAPNKRNIFFPSKLVDYMCAKRPIVAITPEGTTKNIINQIGGIVISPFSQSSIERGILKAIMMFRDGTLKIPQEKEIQKFEVKEISEIYQMCLKENSKKD